MGRRHRRIGWVVVVAALAFSGLSACVSSIPGSFAGLALAAIVSGLLIFFGVTQSGCGNFGACLSIEYPRDACLSLLPPDAMHPCLSIAADANVGPCLGALPPDAEVGPCLSPEPPDAGVGPCLSPPVPDAGPSSTDADLGPCLSIEDSDASAEVVPGKPSADPVTRPAGSGSLERERILAAARLEDRLPADVRARLAIKPGDGKA